MFCRQQAAEFRLHQPELDALGVNLVFIGNGLPAMANDFIDEHHLTNPVWTDPKRASYRLLGFKRGWGSLLSPAVFIYGVKALAAGFRQRRTQGDPVQQGGVLVVKAGGEVVYAYTSATAGDHPKIETVLQQSRLAATGPSSGRAAPGAG